MLGVFRKMLRVRGLLSHPDLNPAIPLYVENIVLNMDCEDFTIHDQIRMQPNINACQINVLSKIAKTNDIVISVADINLGICIHNYINAFTPS